MATGSGFPLIAIEIGIGFLVPLGWAVWELVKLRRERKRDEAAAERSNANAVPPSQPTSGELPRRAPEP
jgi:hypothetical protein